MCVRVYDNRIHFSSVSKQTVLTVSQHDIRLYVEAPLYFLMTTYFLHVLVKISLQR